MMLQIDGSLHRWFQSRGPAACLMASIDDASAEVVYAHFQRSEDQAGYLRMIHNIAANFGLPMSYYHDKHTILRSPAKASIDDELAGRQPMSQVQRVLHDLGVESIAANSPQAKGRVERLFKTLQDRLVMELSQPMSSWTMPANNPGESDAAAYRYSDAASGAIVPSKAYLHAYTIKIDPTRSVGWLDLPATGAFRISAFTLSK